MSQLYNQPVEIEVKYDPLNHVYRVYDTYGEFIPFPEKMWWHCVEYPFRAHFRFQGKPIQHVIEIFIGEYRHRYICKN